MIEIPFHLYIVIHYLLEAFKIGVVAIITLMFATLTESVAVPLLVMTILSLVVREKWIGAILSGEEKSRYSGSSQHAHLSPSAPISQNRPIPHLQHPSGLLG